MELARFRCRSRKGGMGGGGGGGGGRRRPTSAVLGLSFLGAHIAHHHQETKH